MNITVHFKIALLCLIFFHMITSWLCRYENEMAWCMTVEGDLSRLRNVLGEIKLSSENLKIQHTGLNEELLLLKKNHEEVTQPLHSPLCPSIHLLLNCIQHTIAFPSSFSHRICFCCESNNPELLMWRSTAQLIQTLTRHYGSWGSNTRPSLKKLARSLNNGTRARWASRTSSCLSLKENMLDFYLLCPKGHVGTLLSLCHYLWHLKEIFEQLNGWQLTKCLLQYNRLNIWKLSAVMFVVFVFLITFYHSVFQNESESVFVLYTEKIIQISTPAVTWGCAL